MGAVLSSSQYSHYSRNSRNDDLAAGDVHIMLVGRRGMPGFPAPVYEMSVVAREGEPLVDVVRRVNAYRQPVNQLVLAAPSTSNDRATEGSRYTVAPVTVS